MKQPGRWGRWSRMVVGGLVAGLLSAPAGGASEVMKFDGLDSYATVYALDLGPNGTELVAGYLDRTARLWDVASGEMLDVFEGHEETVTMVRFALKGERLLTGSVDGTLRLWDVARGETLRIVEGQAGSPRSVAVTPDGRRVLSGTGEGALHLWELASGETVRTFEGHTETVRAIALSPDGLQALSSPESGPLRRWDVASGELLSTHALPEDSEVKALTFSAAGERAVLRRDDWLLLWDVDREEALASVRAPHPRIFAISPDGSQLVIWARGWSLWLYDTASGERLRIFEGDGLLDSFRRVEALAFSPDGQKVLSAVRRRLLLWDVEGGQPIRDYRGHIRDVSAVAFSRDGRWVMSGASHSLRLWGTQKETFPTYFILRERRAPRGLRSMDDVAFSPDGERVLAAGRDGTLRLWDVAGEQLLRTLEGHTHRVTSVAIGPEGERALSGSHDRTLRLWDVSTGEALRTFEGHTGSVRSMALSPDGRRALSGSHDGTLRLWDVATGETLRTFEGHADWVAAVAFSPGGERVLSGGGDNTLRLWDVASGELLHIFTGHEETVTSVAFGPDGKQVASGSWDHSARVWDVASGETSRTLEGHRNWVNTVAFSPDGRRLLSGANDGTLRLWDLTHEPDPEPEPEEKPPPSLVSIHDIPGPSREEDPISEELLYTFEGHPRGVTSVAFHPDGRTAITGSWDGVLRLWGGDVLKGN